MESSTQPSTRGSRFPPPSEEEKDFIEEDSDSGSSIDRMQRRQRKKHLYLTTSLVTARNITLADVATEEVGYQETIERITGLAKLCRFRRNPYG